MSEVVERKSETLQFLFLGHTGGRKNNAPREKKAAFQPIIFQLRGARRKQYGSPSSQERKRWKGKQHESREVFFPSREDGKAAKRPRPIWPSSLPHPALIDYAAEKVVRYTFCKAERKPRVRKEKDCKRVFNGLTSQSELKLTAWLPFSSSGL